MLGRVIDFLFDRRRSCADCSLYERQAVCMEDTLTRERRRHWEVLDRCDVLEPLAEERDGLIRELIMERMRIADLKRAAARQHVELGRTVVHLRVINNQLKAIAQGERQGRIEAAAELANCRESLRREMEITGLLRTRLEHAEKERGQDARATGGPQKS